MKLEASFHAPYALHTSIALHSQGWSLPLPSRHQLFTCPPTIYTTGQQNNRVLWLFVQAIQVDLAISAVVQFGLKFPKVSFWLFLTLRSDNIFISKVLYYTRTSLNLIKILLHLQYSINVLLDKNNLFAFFIYQYIPQVILSLMTLNTTRKSHFSGS